jgi:DNA-directed RNA polymerase specialized sigma24 family protein
MAKNKSAEVIRRKLAAKRGRGKVRGESGFANRHPRNGIDGVAAKTVSPKQAFEDSRVFRELLASMKDDQIRQIALMRMSGHSVAEIAKALRCSKSTVERRISELKSLLSRRSSGEDLSTRR